MYKFWLFRLLTLILIFFLVVNCDRNNEEKKQEREETLQRMMQVKTIPWPSLAEDALREDRDVYVVKKVQLIEVIGLRQVIVERIRDGRLFSTLSGHDAKEGEVIKLHHLRRTDFTRVEGAILVVAK